MASSNIQVLDGASFQEFITHAKIPVLIDFWAPWCGPCKMIAPVIEEIAAEYAGKLQVAKLNVDENQSTASNFKVNSIPSLLIFKNGREIERTVGFKTKGDLKKLLDKYV